MENPHFEAPGLAESIFVFPPYRRSHLRSQTYRTLVRILSRCYEDAELSLATDFDPQELRAANINHLRQATEEKPCEQVNGDFRSTESGDSAIQKVMAIQDNLEMDSVKDGGFHGTGDPKTLGSSFQCNHHVHEGNHPNELDPIMEGDEVLIHVNNNNPMKSSDHKTSGNDQMSPKKLPEEIVDRQHIMAEEGGSIVQKLYGTIFSLDGKRIEEVSKPKDANQENRVLVAGKGMQQLSESLPKELEIEGIVRKCDAKGSRVPSSEVMVVDDGQQRNEMVSEAVFLYLNEVSPIVAHEQSENNKDDANSLVVDVSIPEHEMLSKDIQMDRLPLICEATMVSPNLTTEDGDIEEGEICGEDGVSGISKTAILEYPIVLAEKETGVCNKRKRGPLSEGKKEKKKLKKRKKRAEQNRKLGVKRLKLHPVTVPKPVVYCRHYVKGRCHEGDKCKFSHDTIPLTKSSPCSYYARHSCMKGDDCPFDHQLSKYPCSNFVSKGSCNRGDGCMFSHKVLQKEESTCTPNLKSEFKPPLIPDNLDSHRKQNSGGTPKQNLVVVPFFTGTSHNSTPQSKAVPKKTTGPPPVGINLLSFGTPSICSSKIKPVHSSLDKNENVEGRNVLNQTGSCLVENSNKLEISSKTAPKGIEFLSFDKTSPDDSSKKKVAAPSSYDDGMKPSQLVNSSLYRQVSPSPFNASVTFGKQIQAVSKTGQSSNELLKIAQTATSKQAKFLFPKASIGNYVRNELVGSPSHRKIDHLSEQNKKSVHDTLESSSTILQRQPGTLFSSGQSSDSLASSLYKGGTSNSAQKAILSTLAFAAKYESLMHKNNSSGSATLSIEGSNKGGNENTNKSSASASVAGNKGSNENVSRSLKNDHAKASKLLDFLLGLGVKSD